MAVSRILCSSVARALWELRSFILLRPIWCGAALWLRLLPGGLSSLSRDWAGDHGLLFCLAPHGVCRAPLLSPGAVGSYPAFSPLLHQSSSPRAIFAEVEDERSGIFSVTLSVAKNFRPALPRFRRACCLVVSGLSSPAFARSRSDRPPSIGRVP